MPFRQQQEQDEHQQYLLANPMSLEAYKYRAQLWDSFFKQKGKENGNQESRAKES